MIEGMTTERTLPRYATWKRVSEVLGRSAGMQAFLFARVLGGGGEREGGELFGAAVAPNAEAAAPAAQPLAAASQLNAWGLAMRWCRALQEVGEDVKRGRLLVPLDDLVKHRLSEREIATFAERGTTGGDERWSALMQAQLERVRNLFRGGAKAMSTLTDDGARRTFAAIGVFALRRLEQLVAAGGDPFKMKITMSTWQRIKAMPRAVRVVWECAK